MRGTFRRGYESTKWRRRIRFVNDAQHVRNADRISGDASTTKEIDSRALAEASSSIHVLVTPLGYLDRPNIDAAQLQRVELPTQQPGGIDEDTTAAPEENARGDGRRARSLGPRPWSPGRRRRQGVHRMSERDREGPERHTKRWFQAERQVSQGPEQGRSGYRRLQRCQQPALRSHREVRDSKDQIVGPDLQEVPAR